MVCRQSLAGSKSFQPNPLRRSRKVTGSRAQQGRMGVRLRMKTSNVAQFLLAQAEVMAKLVEERGANLPADFRLG